MHVIKKTIQLIYTFDIEVKQADDCCKNLPRITSSHNADMSYKLVTHRPRNIKRQTVSSGLGPCGLFACVILGANGFKPMY